MNHVSSRRMQSGLQMQATLEFDCGLLSVLLASSITVEVVTDWAAAAAAHGRNACCDLQTLPFVAALAWSGHPTPTTTLSI